MLPWLASVLGRATVGDDAMSFFFFNDTATTEIYTLSLHDALPISIVIDSSVIIEYLDEIAPVPENFTPRDPAKRAHMRSLMRFIDEMPAAAVRVPTFNLAFLPRFAAMSEEEFTAFAESKPLRKEFMLSMGGKGFPQKEMDAARQRLRGAYEHVDAGTATG